MWKYLTDIKLSDFCCCVEQCWVSYSRMSWQTNSTHFSVVSFLNCSGTGLDFVNASLVWPFVMMHECCLKPEVPVLWLLNGNTFRHLSHCAKGIFFICVYDTRKRLPYIRLAWCGFLSSKLTIFQSKLNVLQGQRIHTLLWHPFWGPYIYHRYSLPCGPLCTCCAHRPRKYNAWRRKNWSMRAARA